MAGLLFTTPSVEVPLVAGVAKTVLRVTAPANQRLKVLGWGVFFDGTQSVVEPVICELVRDDGTGTFTPLTLEKDDPDISTPIQSVGEINASVEPGGTVIKEPKEVHNQSGYEKIYGLGQEKYVPGGGNIGIRCLAPGANVNVIPFLHIEE